MKPADGMKIRISKNGPYLVTGGVPLSKQTIVADENGESVVWREEATLDDRESCGLCRCGKSGRKPFCDGSHNDVNFDGTETASRLPYAEREIAIKGPTLVLHDASDLCLEARFCHRAGGAWNLVLEPSAEAAATVIEEIAKCPSGRYVVEEKATEQIIEPQLEPSIAFVQDPQMNVSGPIWVRGGIEIESSDGWTYEVRNRVSLCRCGESKNKPFCDGSHLECGFHDGM